MATATPGVSVRARAQAIWNQAEVAPNPWEVSGSNERIQERLFGGDDTGVKTV